MNPITLEAAKKEYFQSKRSTGSSPITLSFYEAWLKYYPYKELTRPLVEKYVKWLLDQDIKNRSKITYYSALCSFAKWCLERGYIERDPLVKLNLKAEPVPERPIMTEEEHLRLLETAKVATYSGHKLADGKVNPGAALQWTYACLIGWHTGMRLGDMCRLRWSSIDEGNRVIKLKPNKTKRHGKEVAIPYGEELAVVFERFRGDDDEFVCQRLAMSYKGDFTKPRGMFSTLSASAGVYKGFHAYRHALVTRLIAQNISAELICSITGQNPAQIVTYQHTSLDIKRQLLGITAPNTQPKAPNETSNGMDQCLDYMV